MIYTITFKGTSAEATGDENYTLEFDMTIIGISKQIKPEVGFCGILKNSWGNEKAGYTINGKISRKDWGLNWNATLETGGLLVSDEVKITCEVQLIKQS